jgi:small subunit ribosomal protein S21
LRKIGPTLAANRVLRGQTLYISLDLPAEPCNNYPVQAGPVWGCFSLAEVRLQEGESLENALRRFKRKVQQEDIIKEVKRHSFYLKPGEKKRVKEALARKRSRKKARKEQD